MRQFIDLHTHTTASDGTDTPTELIRWALEADLAAVAVTDHDTVAGLAEAEEAGRTHGIEVIRGCELSVRAVCGELHVLGLWLPQDIGPLEAGLATLRERRNTRNERIVEKLHALGIPLRYTEVLEESGGEVVGRPHIARALVRHGYVTDERAAFERYLRFDAAAYVPREAFSAPEGVRLMADLGATVAVAHPMLARCSRTVLEECIAGLRDHGLSALEAFHAEQNPGDEMYIKNLARRLGLGVTGGSDYHGRTKPSVKLGRGRAGTRVGIAVLEALKLQRQERGLPV